MSRKGHDSATKNFCDHVRRITGTVHTKVRELVRGDSLGVQRAETGFVAEKRATGHGHATRKENIDRRIEPQDRNTGIAQKFRRTLLRIGAAAESEDGWLLTFEGAAQSGAKLFGFQLAKSRFAMSFKELRNGDARGSLDLFVEVNEPPAKLLSQARANGALAGTHETGEAK